MLCEKVKDEKLLGLVKESVVKANNNPAQLVAIRARLHSKLGE